MQGLSAREAARRAAVDQGTIRNAIKAGKLAATRGADGAFRIAPEELTRWAAARNTRAEVPQSTPAEAGAETIIPPVAAPAPVPQDSAAIALLERVIARLEESHARELAAWGAERARLLEDLEAARAEVVAARAEIDRLMHLPVHVPKRRFRWPWEPA